MTFDEMMKQYNGSWEGNRALIVADGGYYWCVATGTPTDYVLTADGNRFMGTDVKVKEVAYTSTDVVVSAPKKRGRSPVSEKPVVTDPVDPDSLDDLDI